MKIPSSAKELFQWELDKGLNKTEIAKKYGVKPPFISDITNGKESGERSFLKFLNIYLESEKISEVQESPIKLPEPSSLPTPSDEFLSKIMAQSLVIALTQIRTNVAKNTEILEKNWSEFFDKIFARFDKIDEALYIGPKPWDGKTNRRHGKERRSGNIKRKSKSKKLLKKNI